MTVSKRTLLLLVDLQRSFCDDEGSMARQGRSIDALKDAAIKCDELASVARDCERQVAWTRMVFRSDYSDGGELIRIRPNLKDTGALRSGSGDEVLSALVHANPSDIIIDKPRFSALYGTSLEVLLRSGRYERVLVGGVTTSMCVESSVRDLAQRDYEVIVVEDACADFDRGRHEASLRSMAFGFARVVSFPEAKGLLGNVGDG